MTFVKIAFLNLLNRRSRTMLTLLAIGVSVAFAILLVSVAVGLNQENNAVIDKQTNFWIIPAGSSVLDPVTNSEKTMLGNAHQRIDEIKSSPDVKSADPVLNKVLYAAKKEPKMVLGMGVIPDGSDTFSQEALTPGDPHFYGNDWTHEVEVNGKLSKLLGVGKGDLVHLSAYPGNIMNSTPFKITGIVDSAEFSNAPVVILHLSELQELTGNLKGDRVNQITVRGENVLPLLQAYFPDAVILSEAEYYAHTLTDDKRVLATATAVTLVSFIMGILFISSAMIFSVNEKQKEFAVMRAIGISNGSIMKIIFYESIMISLLGGAAGVLMGIMGRYVLNEAIRSYFNMDIILSSNPLIPLMVFSAALIAGMISGIVPAISGRNVNIASVLGG
ncbi:MAG: FtsX-like permease family protein [Candidatus Methanoperedens sp.]|nr:FtsX-like permease family protein [Candidatus Methanoperedens sp.]MCZ7370633.1 FtsX-like permease family protein [Candidatus Methanoperedens sp.]